METTLKSSALLCVAGLSVVGLGHGQRTISVNRPKTPAEEAAMPPRQWFVNSHAELACGCNAFVAVGSDGKLRYSSDRTEWREVCLHVDAFIRGVTFGKRQFVAVGGSFATPNAIILTSRNGRQWAIEQCPTKRVLYSVTHGASRFLAVGDGGVILSSRNGREWRQEKAATAATLAAVAFGKGLFVTGGDDGLLLTSTDGARWTRRDSSTRAYISQIAFKADKFYARSSLLQLVSDNGITWSPIKWGESVSQFWSATPWLLLQAKSAEGPGIVARTTCIHRVNSTRGLALASPDTSAGKK